MTDLDAYRDRLGELGDETAARVESLRDQLDGDELVAVAAAVIMLGKAKTSALADATLAALLGRGPLGLAPDPSEEPRLRLAVLTVEVEEDDRVRLARLGRSETLSGAQEAWGEGLRRHRVAGWTRGTFGGCPVCTGLADGTILGPDTAMYRHPGCRCVQLPTEREISE